MCFDQLNREKFTKYGDLCAQVQDQIVEDLLTEMTKVDPKDFEM